MEQTPAAVQTDPASHPQATQAPPLQWPLNPHAQAVEQSRLGPPSVTRQEPCTSGSWLCPGFGELEPQAVPRPAIATAYITRRTSSPRRGEWMPAAGPEGAPQFGQAGSPFRT